MGDEKIDGAAFQALAAKLDGMADAFTDTEREALAAVFLLAGAALGELAKPDVDGFASFNPGGSAPLAQTAFADAWFRVTPSAGGGAGSAGGAPGADGALDGLLRGFGNGLFRTLF